MEKYHEIRTDGRCRDEKTNREQYHKRPFQQLLTLYKRGYRTLNGNVDEQARDFSRILQERSTPILPGERASLWQILGMLQNAGRRMGSLISQKLFFEIVHEIIKDYDNFTLMVSSLFHLNYSYAVLRKEFRSWLPVIRFSEIRSCF